MDGDKTIIATPLPFDVLKKVSLVLLFREYDAVGYYKDWSSLNELISLKSISREDEVLLGEKSNALIIIDELRRIGEQNCDMPALAEYELKFHLFSGNNANDWKAVINDFLKKANRKENKYALNYLLWSLDKDWSEMALRKALDSYTEECTSFIIDTIQRISKILSLDNQQIVQSLFISLGRDYKIKNHHILCQAVKQMIPYDDKSDIQIHKSNAIGLVNILQYIYNIKSKKNSRIETDSDNPFIHLFYWFDNENEPLGNYNILEGLFPYLSEMFQLYVIKRYFQDIRNGYTNFSPELIEQLKNNRYEHILIYRECLFPRIKRITIPLLLDSLLNVYLKNPIQTYNGVLDIAIKNSNPYVCNAKVAWQLLFPLCNGGAIINRYFAGFIDCEKVGKLNEQKLLDEEKLSLFIENQLFGHEKEQNKIKIYKNNAICQILTSEPQMADENGNVEIDCSRISPKEVGENIKKYFYENATKLSESSYRINSRTLKLIDEFFIEDKLLIKPLPHEIKIVNNTDHSPVVLKSSEDVEKCIIDSLAKILKQSYNGQFFEIDSSDSNLVEQLLKLYYYNVNGYEEKFLYSYVYRDLCCPELSETNDCATGLPYFKCRGKLCFKNALQSQTISNESNWRKYSFFHLLEIIKHPMIHETSAGYEPDEEIRRFIGLVHKVMKKYDITKCSKCGHLMFPTKKNSNNNYMYFSCVNPDCPEYNYEHYINTCYNCGELIDSRQTQKCPNGRYICNNCLSCCCDEQFEKNIQMATVKYRSIPSYYLNLRGKGHNDKKMYYCPNCGSKLNETERENDEYYCPKCGNIYSRKIKSKN